MHHIDSNSCVSSWTEQFEGVVFAYGSLWFRESVVLGPFCGVDAVDGRRVSFDYLSVNVDSSNCLIDGEIGWILLVLLSSIIVGWGISEIVHWFVKLFLEVDVVWDIVGSSFVEDWIESSLVCNDGGRLRWRPTSLNIGVQKQLFHFETILPGPYLFSFMFKKCWVLIFVLMLVFCFIMLVWYAHMILIL